MEDKIQKLINLYETSYDSFKGVFVYRNLQPMDTDFTSILFYDDIFHFEFCDDNIEDFRFTIADIKDIKFDNVGSMVVSIIELDNGDVIMIHNL